MYRRNALLSSALVLALVVTLGLPGIAGARGGPTADGPGVSLDKVMSGREAVGALGDRLPDVARSHGMTPDELRQHLATDPHMRVDRNGRLFYADPALEAPAGVVDEAAEPQAAATPDDAFLLHSRPGAARTIYLDFDGHVLTGTAWNSWKGIDTIVCPPWNTDGAPDVFTDAERAKIVEIWQRVAEDYALYDVDVTTEYTGEAVLTRSSISDDVYGVRALVSPISSYFGSYGGLGYVGVFDSTGDYYKPCLIFPEMLANGAKYIAETVSHEVGHTLGLSHDGTSSSSYYRGHGTGETGWAPIMGTAFYKDLSQWSRGEYADANNQQDDLVVMTQNGLEFRADDHGDDLQTATDLGTGPSASADGLIATRTDTDLFAFVCEAGQVQFDIAPAALGPNLDIEVELLDTDGGLVTSDNPTGELAASVSAVVPAGTYYVRVDGVGEGHPLIGYSDYGSLGAYRLSGSFTSPGGEPPPDDPPADDPPPPSNEAPTADVSAAPVRGAAPLVVDLDGTDSSDPDGSVVAFDWDLGDGEVAESAALGHTYQQPGTYVAELVVTDDDGATDAASVTIVVDEPTPAATMRVEAIDITFRNVRGGAQALAAVRVTDADGMPIEGATVTGSWSGLARGSTDAATDSNGVATLASKKVRKPGTITISVTNVAKSGATYDASLNLLSSASAEFAGY
jgi:PKD repeat protein